MTIPLVSCIMPTFNRRRFVPNAIAYFLRQDYAASELVILDDGTEPVGDLVPADPRVRYVRLDQRTSVGTKRNRACELVTGTLIAHWDDDDWHASDRLSRQVELLLQSGADLCGLNTLHFYDIRSGDSWRYIYPQTQRPWLAGGSLMYKRAFWSTHPFPEIDVGEDSRFVWSAHPKQLAVVPDPPFYVAIIHDANISPKQTESSFWQRCPATDIQRVLAADWVRYSPSADATDVDPSSAQASDAPDSAECDAITPEPDTNATLAIGAPFLAAESARASRPVSSKVVRNVFACLVHESLECVVDLVRNLRYLDPESVVLLYDGGNPRVINSTFPFERYGAVVHPRPQPMVWGHLHKFAIDCMQFAIEQLCFDTMTIVDSDQLAIRPGYSRRLVECLTEAGSVGMLGNDPRPQQPGTRVGPAAAAFEEVDLWRPLLRRFPDGESKFVHWTFWPSTVFTAPAAADLVRLFHGDEQLQDILRRTKLWATEEVILPTLVALLGYGIATGPSTYDFVQYRVPYSTKQIAAALERPDAFWAHPVPRHYNNPIRTQVRSRFNHYQKPFVATERLAADNALDTAGVRPENGHSSLQDRGFDQTPLFLTLPLLEQMKRFPGWLEVDEADLLIAAASRSLHTLQPPHTLVEVGSLYGRATVILAKLAQVIRPDARVCAIDPHDGRTGALDEGLVPAFSTPGLLRDNLANAGVADVVDVIHAASVDVPWAEPISFLLVDGLHDYSSVARDFFHFEPFLIDGAYVAFHDYASYFPGVVAFVNELLREGRYRQVECVRSLIVLQFVRSLLLPLVATCDDAN